MSAQKHLKKIFAERPLILDGAMGTQIFARKPTLDDYGGSAFDGCVELLNERRRSWIQEIHASYFNAGADAVETNTFGCNEIVLGEFDISHRAFDLNEQAARLAKEVAASYDQQKFVVGSVGPGTKLLTLLQVDYQTLYRSYLVQMQGLLAGGVDAILIETSQDLGQVKCAVRAARQAMKEQGRTVSLWVQVTIETTGTMLVGSDIQTALTTIEALKVDVLGMNCATGPEEMRPHMAHLSASSPFALSCLPNAGLPENVGGQTVYPLGPALFAQKVSAMVSEFGLNIVGGCCGTTPEHIQALATTVQSLPIKHRVPQYERSVSSLYQAVSLSLDPPLYVGERTNANGSKKFRDLLAQEDFDGLVSIAKGQLKEGAHILDVCVAYVSRNETRDMEEFLKRLVTQVNIPLMVDSTEYPVIERALQLSPGKCIVNSINFEDGEEKARKVLNLCKEYGAAVVALTIDEVGMARTADKKIEIAQRLHDVAVNEFGLDPGDLIFDPLTFTLGSGDEEWRKSAIETLNAIEIIEKKFPACKTILGLSNVSFGLSPYPRQILNSLMLYHGVKRGLDMAILNASKIIPVAKIDPEDRALFEALIFDERRADFDPLKAILAKFTDAKSRHQTNAPARGTLAVTERLKLDIIDGEKQLIVEDALEALQSFPPLKIINEFLLDGMRVVGERFGAGEMQLPFVLESAEAMKAAVRTLEPYMEKSEGYSKGCMILATVKGDVHDIGKNLVDIILTNNGFEVVNLGIKQPIETMLDALQKKGRADAIGMSGLLVKSTVIMKENLEIMAKQGCTVPVILGGAALTRYFVEQECQEVYPGPVFYAQDAFEGLRLMEALARCKETETPVVAEAIRKEITKQKKAPGEGDLTTANSAEDAGPTKIKVIRKGESRVPLDDRGQSSWVRKTDAVPVPPFWGSQVWSDPLDQVFGFLDEFALIRSRWGFTQGQVSDEVFAETLREKAQPVFERWKQRVITEKLLLPQAILAYFPACSNGNTILVFDPKEEDGTMTKPAKARTVIGEFEFPRQKNGRQLCISDYFRHQDSGEIDVLGMQIVTMGHEASAFSGDLYAKGEFTDYFYFHGLGTELTEAYAEMIHKRMRHDWGIVHKDAPTIRQLFSQGYQGSRYSFGYPACPDMEGNKTIIDLLQAQRIGVALSESFQMVPEQTTSALVTWHPQARYFSAL